MFTIGKWFYDNKVVENGSHIIATMNDLGDNVEDDGFLLAGSKDLLKALQDILQHAQPVGHSTMIFGKEYRGIFGVGGDKLEAAVAAINKARNFSEVGKPRKK